MNEQVISEIKTLIAPDISLTISVNEDLLANLETYFISNKKTFKEYKSTLVAIGLLSLYINCHQQINNTLSHQEISRFILLGDYFYSLYYHYCSLNAFHLVKYNLAQKLKQIELVTINQGLPSLTSEIIKFFNEDVPYDELIM